MKAFNQEKALVGAFSVITNLRMDLFEALLLWAALRCLHSDTFSDYNNNCPDTGHMEPGLAQPRGLPGQHSRENIPTVNPHVPLFLCSILLLFLNQSIFTCHFPHFLSLCFLIIFPGMEEWLPCLISYLILIIINP